MQICKPDTASSPRAAASVASHVFGLGSHIKRSSFKCRPCLMSLEPSIVPKPACANRLDTTSTIPDTETLEPAARHLQDHIPFVCTRFFERDSVLLSIGRCLPCVPFHSHSSMTPFRGRLTLAFSAHRVFASAPKDCWALCPECQP